MHKTLIILSLLAISTFATFTHHQELSPLWGTWKNVHKREYTVPEESARFAIFVDNYHKILKFNAENANPRLGLGKFADLTSEEFKALYTGGDIPDNTPRETIHFDHSEVQAQAPGAVDWRYHGIVTPVKDQGRCGSCWTFAATGALEGFYALNHGQLYSFSEQQLVDCSRSSPNSGCDGGNAGVAMGYAASNGMVTEDQYPYTAQDGQCRYQGGGIRTNSGAANVYPYSADNLKYAISIQPVAVSVQADGVFQHYSGGVVDAYAGCGAQTNHAVLAVGYGDVGGHEAFVIKNSWGEGWGDHGYIYLSTDGSANGGAGVCGVLTRPVLPQ